MVKKPFYTKAKGRLFTQRGRYYADFRDFRDVGGKREALKVTGQQRATTDARLAETLAATRLKDLQRRFHVSIIFVTHDFGVVARMCDRVAVMYAGRIVEIGTVRKIFTAPAHPYTRSLLDPWNTRSEPRSEGTP